MTIKESVKGFKDGTQLKDLLHATYNSMSDEFKSRIEGLFDNDEDLAKFGQALNEYKPGVNEFIYSLINQIALVRVNYNEFTSPLADFRKGMLEFGDTIEDAYVEPVKGMLYSSEVPNSNPGDQWKTFKPDIDVIFYKKNKELVYPITINEKQLKYAFRSYRELDKLVSGIMLQLTNADEIDDFALTMKLLQNFGDVNGKNLYYQVHCSAVTDESTAKEFVIAVRSIIPSLKYPSRKYNAKGVLNWTKGEDMYLLVTPQTNAIIDVDVLAKAFNMEKTTLMGHIKEVPDFGDLSNTVALLVSRDFLQIYDTLKEMHTTGVNALHLTQNYFLHHHGIMAVSPFYPAIQFTSASVSPVSAVEITDVPQTLTKGGEMATLKAVVTGGATGAVQWSIVDAPQYASINQNGNIAVGELFSGNSLTVKAVSVEDDTKYATVVIAVRNVGQTKSITISAPASIAKNSTGTCTAVIVGDDTDSVTWSIDGTVTGVSVNETTGVVTVASSATAESFNVVATSTNLSSLKVKKEIAIG